MVRRFRIQFAKAPFDDGKVLKRINEETSFGGRLTGRFTRIAQSETGLRGQTKKVRGIFKRNASRVIKSRRRGK